MMCAYSLLSLLKSLDLDHLVLGTTAHISLSSPFRKAPRAMGLKIQTELTRG